MTSSFQVLDLSVSYRLDFQSVWYKPRLGFGSGIGSLWMNELVDWLVGFIHISVTYRRYHKGPWDIEQVKGHSHTLTHTCTYTNILLWRHNIAL